MTLKDLKSITKRFPQEAVVVLENGDHPIEHFTVELKFDSDRGWLAVVKEKNPNDTKRPLNPGDHTK